MLNKLLKLLGFRQCDYCSRWFWKLKSTQTYFEDGLFGLRVYLCDDCKFRLEEERE